MEAFTSALQALKLLDLNVHTVIFLELKRSREDLFTPQCNKHHTNLNTAKVAEFMGPQAHTTH